MNSNTVLDQIFVKIQKEISDITDIDQDEILMSSSLRKDLEMDSLAAVEVVLAIEEEFDIEIPEEDIEKFDTVKDVCDYIFEIANGLI